MANDNDNRMGRIRTAQATVAVGVRTCAVCWVFGGAARFTQQKPLESMLARCRLGAPLPDTCREY